MCSSVAGANRFEISRREKQLFHQCVWLMLEKSEEEFAVGGRMVQCGDDVVCKIVQVLVLWITDGAEHELILKWNPHDCFHCDCASQDCECLAHYTSDHTNLYESAKIEYKVHKAMTEGTYGLVSMPALVLCNVLAGTWFVMREWCCVWIPEVSCSVVGLGVMTHGTVCRGSLWQDGYTAQDLKPLPILQFSDTEQHVNGSPTTAVELVKHYKHYKHYKRTQHCEPEPSKLHTLSHCNLTQICRDDLMYLCPASMMEHVLGAVMT